MTVDQKYKRENPDGSFSYYIVTSVMPWGYQAMEITEEEFNDVETSV